MTKREIEKLEQACQDYLYMVKHAQSNPSFYAFAYRSLQNHLTTNLCNTKAYWTGMVSEAALTLPKSKRTKEHAYGMTQLAKDILAIEKPTVEKIKAEILSDKSKYNLTTAKENMILRNNNQDYSTISPLVKEA